jgi:hypothetical protein
LVIFVITKFHNIEKTELVSEHYILYINQTNKSIKPPNIENNSSLANRHPWSDC